MPRFVSKMTSTAFTMRVELNSKTVVDVTVSGSGLKYDRDTGAILAGEVKDISLATKMLAGRSWVEHHVDRLMGVDTSADRLGEIFGTKFWNEAKLVVDHFEKFAGMNDGVSRAYFSKDKNGLWATEQSDTLTGYNYNDRIDGRGGDDLILGGKGDDSLYGGRGNDVLKGGTGADLLVDREGNTVMDGGTGRDILIGGRGSDVLKGGSDADILLGGGGVDQMTGGSGADQFVFDLKNPSKLTITDFRAGDVLVNLNAGSAMESYKHFMEHASQSGRNVVYDEGEMHMVLRNTKLSTIDFSDFADARGLPDFGAL